MVCEAVRISKRGLKDVTGISRHILSAISESQKEDWKITAIAMPLKRRCGDESQKEDWKDNRAAHGHWGVHQVENLKKRIESLRELEVKPQPDIAGISKRGLKVYLIAGRLSAPGGGDRISKRGLKVIMTSQWLGLGYTRISKRGLKATSALPLLGSICFIASRISKRGLKALHISALPPASWASANLKKRIESV